MDKEDQHIMNQMNKYNLDREFDIRERLVQTFLIISGFLIAFNSKDFTGSTMKYFYITFWFFLVFILIYYIAISRMKELGNTIDFMAISSSILFSFFIIFYLELQLNTYFYFIIFILMHVSLTIILTLSLIHPNTSEKYLDEFIQLDINKEWIIKYAKINTVINIYKYLGKLGLFVILLSLMLIISFRIQYVNSF